LAQTGPKCGLLIFLFPPRYIGFLPSSLALVLAKEIFFSFLFMSQLGFFFQERISTGPLRV